MTTALLSTKGQLVIPQQFRRALHLRANNRVALSVEGDRLVLRRFNSTPARMVKGRNGRRVLDAPEDAPAMTAQTVKALLSEFP